jgi:hypothetical protein
MTSLLPWTLKPARCVALARYALIPTTSSRNQAAYWYSGLVARSIESLNVCAVTGSVDGGEKR